MQCGKTCFVRKHLAAFLFPFSFEESCKSMSTMTNCLYKFNKFIYLMQLNATAGMKQLSLEISCINK